MISTTIYWLIDIRPKTLRRGYRSGYPFYCGMTTKAPADALWQIQNVYPLLKYQQALSQRIKECGRFIQLHVVEIVPADGYPNERRKHWTNILRFSFPECVNASIGRPKKNKPQEKRKVASLRQKRIQDHLKRLEAV